MIFSVDPKQLAQAIACADRLTEQLRRLNDTLEAGRAGTPGGRPGASPAGLAPGPGVTA